MHDVRCLEAAGPAEHAPDPRRRGEKVFVDFAGDTIDIFDPITGEVRAMKLFVAAMGASNYTYAEACQSQSLSDWIDVHANLFHISAVSRSSWSAIISRPR